MPSSSSEGRVVAVCRKAEPGLPKPVVTEITLIADFGVEGDYHAGKFVRHRYLAKKDPTQPNVRQICLMDADIYTELTDKDIQIGPGMVGENITIQGIDLMQLPIGTQLAIGSAIIEITEARHPCHQLNGIHPNLLKAVLLKEHGQKIFKAGMMGRVLQGGTVQAGDSVSLVEQPVSPSV